MHTMLENKMGEGYLQVTLYKSKVCHLQSWSMIVNKFAGWLMYLSALPNCVSMFHNSTGGLSTTSLIWHDHVFPVA